MSEFDCGQLSQVGEDVRISSNVEWIRPHLAKLGSHIAIDGFTRITTAVNLGDRIHVSSHVSIIGGARGLFVCRGFNNIMAGVRIITVSDRFDDSGLFGAMIPEKYHGRLIEKPVILEPFSNLGTNAVALPGSHLAMGVLVTVGSVIMGETEPWTVYKGNPARPTKKINGSKLMEYAKELGYDFYPKI